MNIKYINQLVNLREQIVQITTEASTDAITINAKTVLELIENCLHYEMCASVMNDDLSHKPIILNWQI